MSTLTRRQAPTERSAVDLAAAIRRRELTSVEVVEAHIERIARTASRINAVVGERFEQARAQAREADQLVAQASFRGATVELPPLFGVPFTVKESFAVKGMPHSAGVLARRDRRAQTSATVVDRLTEAGAIPIAVTNTSELTLWIESENRVYGRTNNPFDRSRTAGGSSGGEGAVVGIGGSPFGIAGDLGGSIRIPALFCGVFGHKPSTGLVPNTGVWPNTEGTAARMLATGPLARRAEDLMPILRLIAGPDGQDLTTVPIELKDPGSVSLDGLQVTTIATPQGSFSRELLDARERAAGALAAAGARIRQVRLPSGFASLLPFLAVLTDGNSDPAVGRAAALLAEAGEPGVSGRSLLLGDGRHTVPTRIALAFERLTRVEPAGLRDKQIERARQIAEQILEAIGDGVLLHPAFAGPAPHHRRTYGRPWLMMPSAIFNLAGVPVTEVPLGLGASGLPVGVQVAAPYGADHLSISIAIELEAVFGGWRPPADL